MFRFQKRQIMTEHVCDSYLPILLKPQKLNFLFTLHQGNLANFTEIFMIFHSIVTTLSERTSHIFARILVS